MASLELNVLGRFEARLQSGPAIELPTKKTELLLAYLALPPGKKHPRHKLAALLWSDRGDEQAHRSFRHALFALRKALGEGDPPPLVVDRETIGLDADAVEIDAVTFEKLVAAGTREALEQASTLYRGDLLEGIIVRDPPFEEWLFYERQRLRDLALRAFEQLLAFEREAGELEKAVETAQRLLKFDPSHEKTHRELMRLYADQGREAAALEQYQHCRAALKRELEVEPGAETEQLYQDILQRHGGPPEKPSPLKPKPTPRRWTAVGGGALLLVAAIVVAVWQLFPSPGPPPTEPTPGEAPALELPDKPYIAVLPFKNLSGDPEQDYFVDGLTEEIITELTRFRGLMVIARNSTFQYKGRSVDVREVGRELGARYVVEGSVRKATDTIRVTAQLLDATSGAHLWAETYERGLTATNIFEVQDEITQKIVATLADTYGVIARAGLDEAKRKRTENLEVYDCIMRYNEFRRTATPETHLVARACLERAVELDPDYAEAWAWLSHAYVEEYSERLNPRPEIYDALDRGYDAAQRAAELDPANEWVRLALARAHYFRREPQLFFIEAERAVELNPNNADVIATIGLYTAYAGQWERGLALIEKAMALSPFYPGWYHTPFVDDHYRKGEYEEALARAHQINMPGYWWLHMELASIYGQLGRNEEARAALAKLLALYPSFAGNAREELGKWYYSEELVERFIEDLRKAGLPE